MGGAIVHESWLGENQSTSSVGATPFMDEGTRRERVRRL